MSSNKMALKEDRMKIGIAFALALFGSCWMMIFFGKPMSVPDAVGERHVPDSDYAAVLG
jgi:hypothetical protein